MANLYVSSDAYTAVTAFQISTAYSVGDIVRPTAAATGRKQVYRCTTAGTSGGSEAAWTSSGTGTTTQGTAVFTAIKGDTYGWSAALGDIKTAVNVGTSGYCQLGDTVFVASDHSETAALGNIGSLIGGTYSTQGTTYFISVNRAGSVPPVAADITAGASCSCNTAGLTLDAS